MYGPHDEATLRQWAVDGRIAPEDRISQDQATWYPASDLAGLEMDWMVRLSDGSWYGPLHLKALQVLVRSGDVTLDMEIMDRKTSRTTTLRQEAGGPAAPAGPEAEELAAPLQASWKDLAQSRDFYDHESRKWKNLYEQERERTAQKEQELTRQLEELRESELGACVRLEQAERQLARLSEEHRRLEEEMEGTGGADPVARAMTWMKSYNDLSRRYDELMSQFTARSLEVQEAREACARAEGEAKQSLRQMEAVVQREKEETNLARKRLAEVEDSHLQLVKSYRELNDRYIRAREQAAQGQPAAPTGPRIKLTRA